MTCVHLKELFRVCETHQLRITGNEMVRIVCPQCGLEEVCPSVYTLEYDKRHDDDAEPQSPSAKADNVTDSDASDDSIAPA
jgi:predicted RNA-binding Zn-ribbon protein involved in translation (DUF1610 family)